MTRGPMTEVLVLRNLGVEAVCFTYGVASYKIFVTDV